MTLTRHHFAAPAFLLIALSTAALGFVSPAGAATPPPPCSDSTTACGLGGAPTGVACTYNLGAGFSIDCQGLWNVWSYMSDITFNIPDGSGNAWSIELDLTSSAGYTYATGTGAIHAYWSTDTAAHCSPGELMSTCAADQPTPWTASATDCPNDASSGYWLFSPSSPGGGNACAGDPNDHNYGSTGAHSTFCGDNVIDYGVTTSCTNSSVTWSSSSTPLPPTVPCTLDELIGPDHLDTPQDAQYSGILTPGSVKVLAVPKYDPAFSTTPPNYLSGVEVDGVALWGFEGTVDNSGAWALDVALQNETNTGSVELYCQDSTGVWYDIGLITSTSELHTPPPATSVGNCIDQADWSFNIGNDFKSMFNVAGCFIEYLFVPSSGAFNTTGFLTGVADKVPFSYVTDGFTGIGNLVSSMSSSISAGACDPPHISLFNDNTGLLHGIHGLDFTFPMPGDVCSVSGIANTQAGELWGFRTFMRDVEALGIWTGCLYLAWRMMPWSRQGDGIAIISQFGGLSDHFMENGYEVRQTNEGSD